MATISPIPGDDSYQDAWNEMRQFVLNSFGIPPDAVQGATALSQAYVTEQAFLAVMKPKLVGMEFAMNMALDPLLEEGRRIYEEWMAEKAAEQKDPERN